MESLVMTVCSLLVLAVILVPLYKWRHAILRWARDPKEPVFNEWHPKRTTIAARQVIKARWRLEDAESQLEWARQHDAIDTETEE